MNAQHPPVARTEPRSRPSGRRALPLLFAAAVVATATALAGCAARAGGPFDDGSPPREIRLIVINHDFNDATLYAFRDMERLSLGVVTGKTERSYTLPWTQTQALRVQITLLSAGSCTTDEIAVDPGEIIELQIQDAALRGNQCAAPRGG